MNQVQAIEIVNKALFGLQRVRSMGVEELTRLGWEEEIVRRVFADLVPWMEGERGKALLNSLATVSDRGTVKGMELYNFMTILHRLDKTLLMMLSAATETMFPSPDIKWVSELGM